MNGKRNSVKGFSFLIVRVRLLVFDYRHFGRTERMKIGKEKKYLKAITSQNRCHHHHPNIYIDIDRYNGIFSCMRKHLEFSRLSSEHNRRWYFLMVSQSFMGNTMHPRKYYCGAASMPAKCSCCQCHAIGIDMFPQILLGYCALRSLDVVSCIATLTPSFNFVQLDSQPPVHGIHFPSK